MKEMKYVMIYDDKKSMPEIIVFPKTIEHINFAFMEPDSAGFINVQTGECYGFSTSLGISAKEEDSEYGKFYIG
jgi:hypothetical protein